jgi:hypothetical protein
VQVQAAKKAQFVNKQLGEMFYRFANGDCPAAAKDRLAGLCGGAARCSHSCGADGAWGGGIALHQGQRAQALAMHEELSRENWRELGAPWLSVAISGMHILIKQLL